MDAGSVDTPSPSTPAETRDRKCPYCRNRSVVALGRVTAGVTGIRYDFRCGACAKEFVVVAVPHSMILTEGGAPLGP